MLASGLAVAAASADTPLADPYKSEQACNAAKPIVGLLKHIPTGNLICLPDGNAWYVLKNK